MSKNTVEKKTNEQEYLTFSLPIFGSKETNDISFRFTLLEDKEISQKYEMNVENPGISLIYKNNLLELASKVKIEGFRPGKVPLKLLESKYKTSVMKDVLNLAIDKITAKLINEKKLNVAEKPEIKILDFNEEKLACEIFLEIIPEIHIPDLSEIKLEKPTFEVEEKHINEYLDKLAQNFKTFKPLDKERPSRIGDALVIDFEGKIDGNPFEGGAAKDHQLELGSKSFIDTFEDQLVGTKPGDNKIVKVKFPDTYHVNELSGKNSEFNVTVHKVLEPEALMLNDNFAEKFSFKSLDELKTSIKNVITAENQSICNTKIRKDLFDRLDTIVSFTLPPSMLKREIDTLLNKKNNEKEEDIESIKQYESIAKRRVKLGLLFTEIAKKDKISVTQEDLNEALRAEILKNPRYQNEIIEYYKNNHLALSALKGAALEDKVVAFILTKATLKEKTYCLEEIKKFLEEK